MEPEEFDAWYEAAFARLVRQVYAMTGDEEEARDCVQEAFVRAWDRRSRIDAGRGRDAWIRTTAHRLAVSRWRRRRMDRRASDRAVGVTVAADGPDERRVALVAALRHLPEAQRVALVLHHIADLSVDEVAAETGAPAGTVKARLSRGRAALADLLAEGATHA
ncbi:SigE family RNA polymerase sigma factor [Phycicoccus sp. BSK3Z-2]|uniref:SigE family RNA polymerase sigma factor n=1 Tax=Phycicoccus avicenniae TaxID=2828860 RepID=A0A941I008_9MICO|nr:SigE family RNA polymerase sigma factor [Phycicoccus avicenniae]MBR7743542.1 SigE family RNA polymerase sigma factor [Phycicoccus avicenniae]